MRKGFPERYHFSQLLIISHLQCSNSTQLQQAVTRFLSLTLSSSIITCTATATTAASSNPLPEFDPVIINHHLCSNSNNSCKQ